MGQLQREVFVEEMNRGIIKLGRANGIFFHFSQLLQSIVIKRGVNNRRGNDSPLLSIGVVIVVPVAIVGIAVIVAIIVAVVVIVVVIAPIFVGEGNSSSSATGVGMGSVGVPL